MIRNYYHIPLGKKDLKWMKSENINQKVLYCDICDKLCIERFLKKITLRKELILLIFVKENNQNEIKCFWKRQMYITSFTDPYDNITFTSCGKYRNEEDNIFFKYLLVSLPSSILLVSLTSLTI